MVFDKNNEIHRIVEFLVGILEKKYAIGLSKKSIEEILKVLQKNIKREIGSISSFTNYLKEDIEEFIKQIDEKYDTKFLEDEDFKKMLLTHVSLLIDRLHNKISYQNPLANELNITYPMMFNIALQFCSMLHEKYNVEVTFDEIGFVAMHFASHMEKEKQGKLLSYNHIGIVCSSGGGSASYDKIPTDAISLNGGNFNTHKGNNYTGVNVGWSLKDGLDFNDIKSIEVELYAGNKKLVTNVAEGVALEKHKELYSGGTRVFSTPFAFGEFKDDYWAFGNWEENIKEALTKATIIINGKAGDKVSITTTSGLSSTEGTKWEQLFDNKEIPTDAIILENFNTHKGTDYTGVNVGWFLKEELNFDDIKSIEVELYSGTEKLATNTAVLEKHAELYKTTKQFSTPFAFDGFEDEYWTFSEWNEDKAKKPTSAKVIIKGKAGDTVVATNNGPLSTTSGTEWYNLFENKAIPTGAITLEKGNFNTHKGDDYTGVNVGWSLADNLNFNDIKRIKVELYADTTLLATNVAEGNILAKHRNLYNKNTRVFSTPFIVKDGSYKEEYWALGKWNPSKEKAPTKAKIIIEGKTGNPESIETNAELAAEAGKSWTELFSN